MTPNPSAPTVANLLQEARALVAQGWCQGWYISGDGDDHWNYCVIGAFNAVTQEALFAFAAQAAKALEAQLPPAFETLDDFNDHPRTTQKRVLALFDRALCAVTK